MAYSFEDDFFDSDEDNTFFFGNNDYDLDWGDDYEDYDMDI